jgi:hypothetical protein
LSIPQAAVAPGAASAARQLADWSTAERRDRREAFLREAAVRKRERRGRRER